MARVETIVVGGGINPGTPFSLFGIPYVSQISPPLMATTDFLSVVPTGVTRGTIIGLADPDATATERLRVLGGAIIQGVGAASVQIGKGSTCPVGAPDSVAIGSAITRTNRQVAIGRAADAGGNTGSIAIGNGATIDAAGTGGVALSGSIGSVTLASVAIQGSIPTGASGVAIAGSLNSSGGEAVAIGSGSSGNNFGAIAIGTLTFVNGAGAIGIGTRSGGATTRATGNSCISIGQACDVSATNAIGIGPLVSATHAGSITIGVGAASINAGCVIGGNSAPITTVLVGRGDLNATPVAVTFRLTNGQGADIQGGTMTLQPGISTGNATPGGLNVDMGIPGASGAVLQTIATRLAVRESAAATETWLMIWDVDTGILQRVSVGANDSGGAGFRLLRIPN